jgi:uncharacterized membrane protein
MDYLTVKWLHIVSSTIVFGTGIGSAFYMLFTSLTRDVRATAIVVRHVVIADWLFTTPTMIIQPLTGFYMMHLAHYPLTARWIYWSLILYLFAAGCWLPVVWIQIKMRGFSREADRNNSPLPAVYWLFMKAWVALGTLAFFAFMAIFYLMVKKPF